jgi:beta-lactamase regulating signal transducer with metallopeptidase domain/Tfp pilus assembly protein PilF
MKPLIDAFSAALLHFAWQGCLVMALLWMALFALRRQSAPVRYAAACAALALLALAPILTTCLLYQAPRPTTALHSATLPYSLPLPAIAPEAARQIDLLAAVRSWALPVWAAGVLLFSFRMAWACTQVATLKRRGEPASGAVLAVVTELGRRMGLTRHARVLTSDWTGGPSLVGWLQPVILLPASAIAGLSPQQLEAVLAHELAHIRRHDYLVNWIQMLVETLLFYHPAVWWISARIRHERELCCDDLAVGACEGALCYARALTTLEKMRAAEPRAALGSTGGPLLYRIQRLAGTAPHPYGLSRASAIAASALALAGLLFSVNWARAQSETSQSYLVQGDVLLAGGVNDLALNKYLQGAAADPSQRVVYQKRCIETYMRMGRKTDAAAVNAQLLQEHPDDSDAQAFAATILLDQGNATAAAAQLQGVLQQVPDNPVAHFDLGRAYQAQGDLISARREFEEAVRLRPDFTRARQQLERLGAPVPDLSWTASRFSDAPGGGVSSPAARNRYAEALPLLQAESEKLPERVDLIMVVAEAAMRAGQYDQAILSYQRVLDRMPAEPAARGDVYWRLGESYWRKGDVAGAVQALEQAHEALPAERVVLLRLISALDAAGRTSEANQLRGDADAVASAQHETTLKLLQEELSSARSQLEMLQAAPQQDPDRIARAQEQVRQVERRITEAGRGVAANAPTGRVVARIQSPIDLALPVQVGEILTQDKMGAVVAAVKLIDASLAVQFVPLADGTVQVQITSPRK